MHANNSPSARPTHPLLEPDREQLRIFVWTIFRHAGDRGFVSLRGFYEGNTTETFRISPTGLSGGLDFLVDAAEDDARRAAQSPRATVFCPVFNNKDRARDKDVQLGLVLSAECDQHPNEARAKLEAILGPATIVVKSGGRWINGSGVAEDKLHLHWVLVVPASEVKSLQKLKQARQLATRLVGGDGSGAPINHPYRWPGSWHRKGEPRMCVIENVTDNEIDLDTALQKLQAAVPDADLPSAASAAGDANDNRADGGLHYVQDADGEGYYDSSLLPAAARLVQAAVKAIRNDFTFDQPSREFWSSSATPSNSLFAAARPGGSFLKNGPCDHRNTMLPTTPARPGPASIPMAGSVITTWTIWRRRLIPVGMVDCSPVRKPEPIMIMVLNPKQKAKANRAPNKKPTLGYHYYKATPNSSVTLCRRII
jgi:hypothetical protein